MSEWLTTGEMIDRLKVGEVAKTVNRIKNEYIHCTENGFYWGDNDKQHTYGKSLIVNDVVAKMKWVVIPKYVTFEEAMKALKNGKKVQVEMKDYTNQYKIYFEKIWSEKTCKSKKKQEWYDMYDEMLEGKWQIIE